MKASHLVSIFAVLFSVLSQAATFEGTIERYQGRFVENPNREYNYLAFTTQNGLRIRVPSEINAEFLEKHGHKVVVQAKEVVPMFCTDMSRACLSGEFKDIQKIIIAKAPQTIDRSGMTCMAYWTGYEFENGECVQRGGSGCSNPFTYKTYEECAANNL